MMRRFSIAVRTVAVALATAWAVSSLCLNAQEQAKSKPDSLDGLKGEFTAAMQAWQEKYSADLTTPSAQLIERYDTWPGWSMVPRVIDLATGNGEAPESFDALLWYFELSRAVGRRCIRFSSLRSAGRAPQGLPDSEGQAPIVVAVCQEYPALMACPRRHK